MKKEYLEANKKLWNNKTPVHAKSEMYELDAFLKGKNVLNKIELEGLGDVSGKSMLHLQCHFGLDTMSWQRMGAQATGIDFSSVAIKQAREISDQLGLKTQFVESDVYALPDNLKGQFDIIFTSYGTITWLPDLDKWASVIRHFLKPGGVFYIAEFHPAWYIFDFDTKLPAYHYFNQVDPYLEVTKGTYADTEADLEDREFFWMHSIEETLMSLVRQGLQLEEMREFDYSPHDCFPNLTKRAENEYVFDTYDISMPHVFSLKMRG